MHTLILGVWADTNVWCGSRLATGSDNHVQYTCTRGGGLIAFIAGKKRVPTIFIRSPRSPRSPPLGGILMNSFVHMTVVNL